MKKEIIAHIRSLGYSVWMRSPENAWLIYERDGRIGMFENAFAGPRVLTVHKPNVETGTGFKMCDTTETPSEDELKQGFALAPEWYGHWTDFYNVKKYKDIEDFRKASAWNGAYRLIKEGEGQ
jgi:hypothetical protein